jgi:sugar phosphate isomerase/epimerase
VYYSLREAGMKTSIATVSISGEFAEKLAAISTAGFEGIEIFENDFLAFDGTPGVKNDLAGAGWTRPSRPGTGSRTPTSPVAMSS